MNTTIPLQDAMNAIWTEAYFLDERNYDDWLDLWTDDGLYVVPIEKGSEDFADRLNYAYDDAKMRKMRVARLKSSHSMSALTVASTVRTVSRFIVTQERADEIDVCAAQLVAEFRRDKSATIAANVDYTLRRVDGKLKLAKKVVWLVNSEDAVSAVGYLQ